MHKPGVETHADGSATITFADSSTKDGTSQRWLKAECWKAICANFSVVRELPLNKSNRRDAVIEARQRYPSGSLAVIVTTAAEILGMDPDDSEVRRKLCGLVNENAGIEAGVNLTPIPVSSCIR